MFVFSVGVVKLTGGVGNSEWLGKQHPITSHHPGEYRRRVNSMKVTPEDIETWDSFDNDVKEQVISAITMSRDSSDMNDDDHPKNQQYSDAFSVVVGILEG